MEKNPRTEQSISQQSFTQQQSTHKLRRSKRSAPKTINLAASCAKIYQDDEIKILTFLALISIFKKNYKIKVENYHEEVHKKQTGVGRKFRRNQNCLIIEPISKEIARLYFTEKYLVKLEELCIKYLLEKEIIKKEKIETRKFLVSSVFSILNNQRTQSGHCTPKKLLGASTDVINMGKAIKDSKQSSLNNSLVRKIQHRRFISDIPSTVCNESHIKMLAQKKQQLFISKKKQEVNFLRKINIDMEPTLTEPKSIVEMIEVFLRNILKSNYLIGMIIENGEQCEKILVYIMELNKIFESLEKNISSFFQNDRYLKRKNASIRVDKSYAFQVPIELQKYLKISQIIIAKMQTIVISPTISDLISSQKSNAGNLISNLLEARYTLRHLQKQIENMFFRQKKKIEASKWQTAYRAKFLPKKSLY